MAAVGGRLYGEHGAARAAVLFVLGLIILPQDVREEILSVIVKEEKVIEPPPLETLVEEPEVLEEQVIEDEPTDAETLVESDDVEAEDPVTSSTSTTLNWSKKKNPRRRKGPSLPVPVGNMASGRSTGGSRSDARGARRQ